MHNEFKIDVNKRYQTLRGDTVVFSLEQEEVVTGVKDNVYRKVYNSFGPSIRLLGGFEGLLIDGFENKYEMTWHPDGTVVKPSISSRLLQISVSSSCRDADLDAFAQTLALKEYVYVDMAQYFKDREDELKMLTYKRQQLCNLLGNVNNSIDILEEAEVAILKIAEYRDCSNKILELMEKDVTAIHNMENPDSTLLKIVSYNLQDYKTRMDDFESEHIVNIEAEIVNIKYGYVVRYIISGEDEERYKQQ